MVFSIGQRWISSSEAQLGLGMVLSFTSRQVRMNFPAVNEERMYSTANAPLSRIIFKIGDEISNINGVKLTISHVEEQEQLIVYHGIDELGASHRLSEVHLSCYIDLNTPQQRLFSGLVDKLSAFKLRIDTLNHYSRIQQSPVKGLMGSRTNHLKHQLYIAKQVAARHAPRVLLADEVGLGKTIESGMIVHHQIITGSARNILIVVPHHLIHQWLVEMMRRFNLYFSLIDASRYNLVDENTADDDLDHLDPLLLTEDTITANPFATESLILCSLEFLLEHELAQKQALAIDWDLLVVDEAHHLHWSENNPSPQYQCIEQLSAQSKGLLLLTATPQQAGIQSHFARLRLIDPARFHDFKLFLTQEDQYRQLNHLLQEIRSYPTETCWSDLSPDIQNRLKTYLEHDMHLSQTKIINHLLDLHGTGRVLFRNTRKSITGFPARDVHLYPLETPPVYSMLISQSDDMILYPELYFKKDFWLEHDSRVHWLANRINTLKSAKILIICAHSSTAVILEEYLKLKIGIKATSFHEGLSIIERDRAAAYFADEEDYAQVMICSEIGSEGRNFQFAHHLILFDLPLNPDLIEQRIGRLDRIGQRHSISIHIPYLQHTAQERLCRWYHEGFDLFSQSCAIGYVLYEHFNAQLHPLLSHITLENTSLVERLISETQVRANELMHELREGRDQLLEMNSYNEVEAEALVNQINAEERTLQLEDYMAQIFQEYGIEHEFHSEQTEILKPGSHMSVSDFPGLKEDGLTITYSRNKALQREDIEFLSWEHPIVSYSMEMILNSEIGNATLATISIKNIQQGTVFLELFYTAHCSAPKSLQLERFLPLSPMRIFMNVSGKDLSNIISYEQLNQLCSPIKHHLAYPIISQIRHDIETILHNAKKLAAIRLTEITTHAQSRMEHALQHEISRIEALAQVNPAIRADEINFFKQQLQESQFALTQASLQLQALRVVINK